MDVTQHKERPQKRSINRPQWRFINQCLVIVYIISLLVLQCNSHSLVKESSQTEIITKTDFKNLDVDNVGSKHCHSCQISRNNENSKPKDETIHNEINTDEEDDLGNAETNLIDELLSTVTVITKEYLVRNNRTEEALERNFEDLLDKAMSKDRYEIFDGIVIQTAKDQIGKITKKAQGNVVESRALFSKFTLEYRLYNKIKNFIDTHVLSINLPKAARLIGFRSFGLKKILLPIIVGAQIFKGILFAMFLPSILGSFGKILGKGISQLSASSSQASYPPAQTMDDQDAYNENKDIMAYETDPAEMYAFPQDGQSMYTHMGDANDVNDLGQVDLSRLTPTGQKMSYLPTKNSYYKNQMQSASSNNYKVFQKIPASSMILSNYDPFYSPLLSRLDGIFARLGLAPSENLLNPQQIGGQSLSDVKLEACREQLICLMYSSPAKYAPYSNLVSAQLSRELNDLRRPVSDNPEILRFFRYMRAARRGQEGVDCMRAHPGCASVATPSHTMFAAFNDINKLVTARKLKN